MYSVRTINETRSAFAADNVQRAAFNRMSREVMDALLIEHQAPIKIVDSEELSVKSRSALVIWSASPGNAGEPAGNIVYAIPSERSLTSKKERGLHRWVLSCDVNAETKFDELLINERSQLVIPGLDGFAVQTLRGMDWAAHYSGAIPEAMRVIFENGDEEDIYEVWFPNS